MDAEFTTSLLSLEYSPCPVSPGSLTAAPAVKSSLLVEISSELCLVCLTGTTPTDAFSSILYLVCLTVTGPTSTQTVFQRLLRRTALSTFPRHLDRNLAADLRSLPGCCSFSHICCVVSSSSVKFCMSCLICHACTSSILSEQ